MTIFFHTHALERMKERGVSEEEVILTIEKGESFNAKFGRTGFRHNFRYESIWRDKFYNTKQIEVYAVRENSDWNVITVITRYF